MDFIVIILFIFLLTLQEVLLDQSNILLTKSDSETLIKTLKSIEQRAESFSKSHGEQFELSLVDKMAEYQMQMIYHYNHSFERITDNDKWTACLNQNENGITNIKEEYKNNSTSCSRIALRKLREAQQGVSSILKQVRGWQKGYKYLKKLCKEDNENIIERENCLIQYLSLDKYNDTLLNLLQYLENSQNNLESSVKIFIEQLDDCLQDVLSQTITEIRKLMTQLNKCYEEEVRGIDKTISKKKTEIVGELKRKNCGKKP